MRPVSRKRGLKEGPPAGPVGLIGKFQAVNKGAARGALKFSMLDDIFTRNPVTRASISLTVTSLHASICTFPVKAPRTKLKDTGAS